MKLVLVSFTLFYSATCALRPLIYFPLHTRFAITPLFHTAHAQKIHFDLSFKKRWVCSLLQEQTKDLDDWAAVAALNL